MPQRDSLAGTVMVTAVLCVVCSLAVSSAAVILRPLQDKNKVLDQQINILDASGLALGEYGLQATDLNADQIKELNGWVSAKLVDLETGEYTDVVDIEKYDLLEQIDKNGVKIENPEFDPGEPKRPKVMKVFFVTRPGSEKPQQVVLPVYGKGLWGTLYGYLAVKSDLETIQGLTFYQHKETPGLGGEVDNTRWKSQWENRKLFDPEGNPAAEVFKGPAPSDNPYAVDGLSGATITSRGVTSLLRYWASDDGYGKYLEKLEQELGNSSES
ncbi:MAG: Na(+)-translocating NADH-quinone reductase subunit C [Planctomycetota bacterium]